MRELLALFFLMHFACQVSALEIRPAVEQVFIAAGGERKSLDHLKCFLEKYDRTTFLLKPSGDLEDRCNLAEQGEAKVSVGNFSKAVIVDYTKPSTQRRFFVLDLSMQSRDLVSSYYVSHGRFGETSRSNTTPGPASNTIRDIRLFSNEKGSNASSSGFFISGFEYQGSWSGPNDDKHSLVLHGLERNINDNACDRAVVVHGNSYIRESGSQRGVRKMSSGCYMLDYNVVNEVVAEIRGGGGPFHSQEPRNGGVVFLTYGPREAQMDSQFYCSEESRSVLRVD